MAKQRLGQHFLFDGNMLRKIVDAVAPWCGEPVLEIGPGKGPLTAELSRRFPKVYAVELDRRLVEELRERFTGMPNVEIIAGDILETDIDALPVETAIGNIPYYITTPIIFRLIDAPRIKRFGLLMQKEVALRVAAREGGGDYGVLSVNAQTSTVPSVLFTVKKAAFSPPPKVDSAFVLFEKKNVSVALAGDVRNLARVAFSMRRKTLANNLKPLFGERLPSVMEEFGLAEKMRPEELPVETFAAIARRHGETIRAYSRSHR